MPDHCSLILMGLRCSGKSTVGRLVAASAGVPFVDLDDQTASLLQARSPGEALAANGEDRFREAEVAALMDQLQRMSLTGPIVLALGGGTPTAPDAPEALRFAVDRCGAKLAYLHAPPELLRSRLAAGQAASRPPLTPRGTLDEVADLYARRDPLYRSLAGRTFDASQSSERLAAELTAWLAEAR